MRAFVTGIGGFGGSHLAEHLLERGFEVHGLVFRPEALENLGEVRDRVTLHRGDILDRERLEAILREVAPEWVFHLAAQSSVRQSWVDPVGTLRVNAVGGANLLEACLGLGKEVRVLVVGSGQVHGEPPGGAPLDEGSPLRPATPYAVSKLALDLLAEQYARAKGLWAVRARSMNHIGPRQSPEFVASDFARQVAEAERGVREPVLRVGNLESRRDFTDVRDVVRAYRLLLERGEPGEVYLVCSGRSRSIRELVDALLSLSPLPFRVEHEAERTRPGDIPLGLCSPEKLRRATGWEPEIPFEKSLEDTLNYWRARVEDALLRHRLTPRGAGARKINAVGD